MDRARYLKTRRHLINSGRWEGLADYRPAREHVLHVQARFGLYARPIAALAGCHAETVRRLIGDDPVPIPAITSRCLLAVWPDVDALPPRTLVHPYGTRRRIQALAVLGWSTPSLSAQLGHREEYLQKVLLRDRVFVDTHRRVRDLYERLEVSEPVAVTRSELCSVRWVQAQAARAGWPPPAAWDETFIDLPYDLMRAELDTQVQEWPDKEIAIASYAYRTGDRTPLAVAASREYRRRREAAHVG